MVLGGRRFPGGFSCPPFARKFKVIHSCSVRLRCWQRGNGTTVWRSKETQFTKLVHINMDEICVRMSPELRKGAIAVKSGWTLRRFKGIQRKNGLRARRSSITYALVICDNVNIMNGLPHVIVGGEHIIQAWMTTHMNHNQTDNIFC